jgi:hypothetical protein
MLLSTFTLPQAMHVFPPSTKLEENFDITDGVRVNVDFASNDAKSISLGPHTAIVQFNRPCANPRLWLRVEGDALVTVRLTESSTKINHWSGSFSLPIKGSFNLVAHWYGCDLQSNEQQQKRMLLKEFQATGYFLQNVTNSIFPASSWISSKKFPQMDSKMNQPWIWHDPNVPTESATLLKSDSIHLSKEGSATSPIDFYSFYDLSNYELVCWIGSESSKELHASFLKFRALLFRMQRQFKFHYYPSPSFEKPDRDWSDETKKRLRKCKHILVSFDEIEKPLSQSDYITQVQTFINHLLKIIPDETFPIWMFTVSESPIEPNNCNVGPPSVLPRTSDHPCNDALRALFRNSPFPDRVQLLDSTDVSLPQLGENKAVMIAAIAVRIYVFVGKQVLEWRNAGQKGIVKGLVRGGKTEPNFELIPYTEWS